MGLFFSSPVPQQPVIIQQGNPGQVGQTTVVYGTPPPGYYYNPAGELLLLAEVALVADIVTDNGYYGHGNVYYGNVYYNDGYNGGGYYDSKKTKKNKKIKKNQV
jgi:hypothetical protein